MCDPLSAVALAGSVASAGISYMGQQDTMAAQQKANDDWLATQRAAAAKASAADEVNRQKAQASLSTAETALSPASQEATQQAAQASLNTQMLAGSPAAPDSNIALLGGEPADTSVSSDMATRVTNAARDAQGRIAALAGMSSYGGGYGGMGAAAGQALANSAEGIGLASDFRKGDTATLGVTQAIQPIQYTQGSNIAGTIADKLGGIAGSAFGSKLRAS